MSPSSIPWEKRSYRFLAGLAQSPLLQLPTHSTYANAWICALLEMAHLIRARREFPEETAGHTHLNPKTRKFENAGKYNTARVRM